MGFIVFFFLLYFGLAGDFKQIELVILIWRDISKYQIKVPVNILFLYYLMSM